MKSTTLLLLLPIIPALISLSSAEVVMSAPIGVNKITCPVNSDTIVGVPFRKEGSRSTQTAGAPIEVVGEADLREIPLDGLTLEAGSLTQHYLKFDSGTRDGRWYDITGNSTTSVTIDLNGDTLDGVTTGDRVTISEYWTLNALFPPDQATTGWTEDPVGSDNWVPNGHAIVASLGTRAFQRRTEIYLPNIQGDGINRSASGPYYILNNQWHKFNGDGSDEGNLVLYPDAIQIIRHPNTITHPTEYRTSGEVVVSNLTIPIHTQNSGDRDTYVAVTRPVDLTLSELNLWESGAFVQSLGSRAFERRDELMVFDNALSGINKAVTSYYHNGSHWVKVNDETNTNQNGTLISAASGFIIRKHPTTDGATVFWQNTPTY